MLFRLRYLPGLLLFLLVTLLSLGWGAVLLFDLLSWTFEPYTSQLAASWYPLLWYHLFSEARPVEWLQWFCLALALLCTLWLYTNTRRQGMVLERRVFFLLSCGLALMLAEDSLNVRHVMVDAYWLPLFGDLITTRLLRMVWESLFYFFLSALMVPPLWRMLFSGNPFLFPPRRLLLGYALYGAVGFGSALRRLGDWQERLGHWVIETTNVMSLPAWQEAYRIYELSVSRNPDYSITLGYLLTDHLIEESVELLAASLLVSGILVVFFRYQRLMRE